MSALAPPATSTSGNSACRSCASSWMPSRTTASGSRQANSAFHVASGSSESGRQMAPRPEAASIAATVAAGKGPPCFGRQGDQMRAGHHHRRQRQRQQQLVPQQYARASMRSTA